MDGRTDYGASRQINLHLVKSVFRGSSVPQKMNRAKLHIIQCSMGLHLYKDICLWLELKIVVLNWILCRKLRWLVKWESIVTPGPILQKVYIRQYCRYWLHLH